MNTNQQEAYDFNERSSSYYIVPRESTLGYYQMRDLSLQRAAAISNISPSDLYRAPLGGPQEHGTGHDGAYSGTDDSV